MLTIVLLSVLSLPVEPMGEWTPVNAQRLEAFLAVTRPASPKPVAVFDWDNTIIHNDVGDAVFYWMLTHNLFKTPRSWAATSPLLSPEAATALTQTCPARGSISPKRHPACADLLLSIYGNGALADGKPAWRDEYNKDLMEPGYAWAVQLTAGRTPSEMRTIANEAIHWGLAQPKGSTQTVGTKKVAASLRIYMPISNLIAQLQFHGFDVWVVSASSQYLVDVMARLAGIRPHHVIGVRPVLDRKGRITARFQGCGDIADGNSELITYRQGKRCWINKVILGVNDPQDMMARPSAISFAAGDSDTDVFFVRDAADMRVVIDRRKPELTCLALANADGNWLLQPMFIQPKDGAPVCAKPNQTKPNDQ